jgi:hypothetical protein
MTVGARHRFSALERAFRYQKAASKRLYQPHIEIYIKKSIGYFGSTRVYGFVGFLILRLCSGQVFGLWIKAAVALRSEIRSCDAAL